MDILNALGMKPISIDPTAIAILVVLWRFDKRLSNVELQLKGILAKWHGLSRGSQNRQPGSDLA